VVGAFHAAYFARMERLGPADLEKALGRKRKPTASQSDEELGAAIREWLKTSEDLNDRAKH